MGTNIVLKCQVVKDANPGMGNKGHYEQPITFKDEEVKQPMDEWWNVLNRIPKIYDDSLDVLDVQDRNVNSNWLSVGTQQHFVEDIMIAH